LCNIAVEILEQKALCQQDPDQDEDEQAPEYQAEYDSVLISSAGDLVSALANVLGPAFVPAFQTFFPLISKFYVCSSCDATWLVADILFRERTGLLATVLLPSAALRKLSLGSRAE
jgi:hypothetical protein